MKKKMKRNVSIIKFEPGDGVKDGSELSTRNKRKSELSVYKKNDEPGPNLSDFDIIERFDEDSILEREWVEVTDRTRWKCQKCGWCCTRNWRINLTWKEYDRLKDKLTIHQVVVDEPSGMSHPVYTIKNKCERFDPETKLCTIYKDRLYACAAFPFNCTLDGVLVRSKFCKGFGKGEIVDRKKLMIYLNKWRKRAGMKKF